MEFLNYLSTLALYFFETKWVGECEISCFTLIISKVMRKCNHEGSTVFNIIVLYVIRHPLPFFFNIWKHSINRLKSQFI